jgi:hypothetical protein
MELRAPGEVLAQKNKQRRGLLAPPSDGPFSND